MIFGVNFHAFGMPGGIAASFIASLALSFVLPGGDGNRLRRRWGSVGGEAWGNER